MIVKIMTSGRSFTAAGRYHLHDAPFTDGNGRRVNPTTSGRVRFTAARNLVNDDARLAMLEMWHTAASQTHLKAAAGLRGGGTAAPVKTIVLS